MNGARSFRLLVARHGQIVWNAERRIQGQRDIPLRPEGETQARRLGARLRNEHVDAAYASDLTCAWRAAEFALEGRGLTVGRDAALREAAYGEWEGLTLDEAAAHYPEL